jgi:hypothetical protein
VIAARQEVVAPVQQQSCSLLPEAPLIPVSKFPEPALIDLPWYGEYFLMDRKFLGHQTSNDHVEIAHRLGSIAAQVLAKMEG